MMNLLQSLLCLLPGLVMAQGLADPTRPPAIRAETTQAGVAGGGPVLQSVMLSPTRKVAVISGEMVALGGRYGGARLVRLTETEAVLQNGVERTVLRLHPQVDKKPAGSKAANMTKK